MSIYYTVIQTTIFLNHGNASSNVVLHSEVVPKDDVLDLKVGVQEDQDFKFSMMINIWDNETGIKPTDLDRIGYMWYGLRENQYWPDWGAQLTWTRLPYHTCTKDDLNSFPEKI